MKARSMDERMTMSDGFPTYSRAIRSTGAALYNRLEDRWIIEDT